MKNRGRVTITVSVFLIGIAVWVPLRSMRVAAQSSGSGLKGSFGFTATAQYALSNPNPVAVLGVITFDGAGNLTGNQTIASSDLSATATTVQTQTVPFTGTYSVNADGTGSLTTQIPGGGTNTVSFVITDGGSGLMFVLTAGTNSLITGTARKQ